MRFTKKHLIICLLFILFNFIINQYSFADELPIYSPSAILIDSSTGNVLYEKNSNQLMYPASTTKVLTAIIAIESCTLDTKMTASENAINSIKSGYTNAKIQVGEELSLEDLLYALMLKSANEAANVIAEHIGGTTENFANIMNAKAMELGCFNTHFVNANGIHNDNHYTTASDLAKITQYCMQNETFRKIACTKEYTLPATPQYPSTDRILKNTNSLMSESSPYYYPYAIAGKTGFTTQAKNCLICMSDKNGLELISVVLHAESTEDGRSARYLDTINLLEYGNNNYKSCTIVNQGDIIDSITVSDENGNSQELNLLAQKKLALTLPISSELEIASSDISINNEISLPIKKGDILGNATYTANGMTFSTDLIAESDIEQIITDNTASSIDFKMIGSILIILIAIRLLILGIQLLIKDNQKGKRYLNP